MRHRKYHLGLLGLVILLMLPSLVYSQAKVGTTGLNFLELGVSARAMGMAEAFTAGVTDASAVYYNPAGLPYVYGREVMFTHISMPAGINYEFAAMVLPMESLNGVIGFGVYSLNTGDIPLTDYFYPYAADNNDDMQYFSAGDFAFSISYGRFLTDKFSLGITAKFIHEGLALETTSGWAADVGTCYNSGYKNFKIGMAITNFGPDFKYDIDNARPFPLPMNFKFGASIDLVTSDSHLLILGADGNHPADNLEKYNFGAEYWFQDKFSLRIGERFNYDSDGLTAGAGLRLPVGEEIELAIDYAYQDFGYLTQVHRFSIGLGF